MEEVRELYEGPIQKMYQSSRGFCSAQLLLDPATYEALSITVWENVGCMAEAGEDASYRETMSGLVPLIEGFPAVSTLELACQIGLPPGSNQS